MIGEPSFVPSALAGRIAGRALLGVVVLAGCNSSRSAAPQESEPQARVELSVAREGAVRETLQVYGTVVPAPGSAQTFVVPYDCQVEEVMVNVGQDLSPGEEVIRVVPSPSVRLNRDTAQKKFESQRQLFQQVSRRFDLGIATRQEKIQAKLDLDQAAADMSRYESWFAQTRLRAPARGVVREVLASEGGLMAAGSTLLSASLENRVEVRAGVETEDVDYLIIGQEVKLRAPAAPLKAAVSGRIRSVARMVDLNTRLVEVLISVPETAGLLLNEFVTGEIEIRSSKGIVVPRSAVLPRDGGNTLFEVRGGRAYLHRVTVGLESSSEAQVRADGLEAGDSVVTVGSYVLSDSMRVRTSPQSTNGAPNP